MDYLGALHMFVSSGRGRQLFESCKCHECQDLDRLARDRQP